MLTVLLLTISNIFMTFAWYGHLKFKESPLAIAILVSWLIAFAEYCFQVPANRWGSAQFSPVQLKVMQEIITLVVFSVFAVFYLDTKLGWNHLAAFLLIVGAVFLVRQDSPAEKHTDPQEQVVANDPIESGLNETTPTRERGLRHDRRSSPRSRGGLVWRCWLEHNAN